MDDHELQFPHPEGIVRKANRMAQAVLKREGIVVNQRFPIK
jgi:hypothetical protein